MPENLEEGSPRVFSDAVKQHILDLTRKMMDWVIANHDHTETGGYLYIIDAWTGEVRLEGVIGTLSQEKRAEYSAFAKEKAGRLRQHHEHILSFQSRNEANSQYPGAVRTPRYILSFSGLAALWDEAIMLNLAVCIQQLHWQVALQIADEVSSNTYYHLLRAVVDNS